MIPKNTNFSNSSLADLLAYHKDDTAIDINCHAIGVIQSFNPTLQTATASINYQKVIYLDGANPTLVSYPVLIDCPVKYPFGGLGGVTLPFVLGDECVIGFNDRDIDTWFAGTTNQAPTTARLHSFTDAIIFGGIKSRPNVIKNFDPSRPALRNFDGDAYVAVGTTKIEIAGNSTTLNTVLQSLLTTLEGLTVNPSTGIPNPPFLTNLENLSTQIAGFLE